MKIILTHTYISEHMHPPVSTVVESYDFRDTTCYGSDEFREFAFREFKAMLAAYMRNADVHNVEASEPVKSQDGKITIHEFSAKTAFGRKRRDIFQMTEV